MAHFAYKKTFQNQKVRDRYLDEHAELRKAREAGLLDRKMYKAAKKSMVTAITEIEPAPLKPPTTKRANSFHSTTSSSSSDSITAPSKSKAKPKKGTIFDRANVAARIFAEDAQTQDQREVMKKERKLLEEARAEAEREQREQELQSPFKLPADSSGYGQANYRSSATSGSSGSSTRSSAKFNLLGKLSSGSSSLRPPRKDSISRSPVSPAVMDTYKYLMGVGPLPRDRTPSLPSLPDLPSPLLSPRSPRPRPRLQSSAAGSSYRGTGPSSDHWGRARSNSVDTVDSSIILDSRKLSLTTMASGSIRHEQPAVPEVPQTLADKWFFGTTKASASTVLKKPYAKSIAPPSRRSTRRHSFSSQDCPSFSFDQRLSDEEGDKILASEEDGLPYGLTNGFNESHYIPPSMLLLDLFASLVRDFGGTSRLFEYARNQRPPRTRRSSIGTFASSSQQSVTHPGKLVVLDEELEDMKTVLTGKIWFLMTLKWQYFGRVLFSPGHHLLQLGHNGGSRPGTAEQLRVLDLDGPLTADWSWMAAHEYPDVTIYSLTTSSSQALTSSLTTDFLPPPNQRRVQITNHADLFDLPSDSFDAISSRNLPRFLKKSDWLPVLRECHRLLKHDGYLEITILDPVFNDMGPVTRRWISEKVLSDDHPRTFDIMPSKTVLNQLLTAGFREVNKVWMWMPVTSIGDELSTVTSRLGRYLYDELYAPPEVDGDDGVARPREHGEVGIWKDVEVVREMESYNTAFRWLKCYARKPERAG